MKIHVFPPSGRVVGIVALKNYLALDCELKPIDLGRGDQRAPEYVSLNPNRKIPTLEDDRLIMIPMDKRRRPSCKDVNSSARVWRSLRPGRCAGSLPYLRVSATCRPGALPA